MQAAQRFPVARSPSIARPVVEDIFGRCMRTWLKRGGLRWAEVLRFGILSLQRHLSALTKVAHVESRFFGRKRQRFLCQSCRSVLAFTALQMCHLSKKDKYVCQVHQGIAEAVTCLLGSVQFLRVHFTTQEVPAVALGILNQRA